MFKKIFAFTTVSTILTACANMPTNPAQITGAYVSDLKYASYTCEELDLEATHLADREIRLVQAQEQRIDSSSVQAFWIGYGNGDGIEASELAQVRGHANAVRRVMIKNQCKNNF